MRRQSASKTRYTISTKNKESFSEYMNGIADAGVLRAGSSLHARQRSLAMRASGADVAIASAMEALPLQVQGDDEARAQMRHSACDWGVVHGIGFSLDGGVDCIFPDVCRVSAMEPMAKINTFRIFTTLILELFACVGDNWGSRHSADIDTDVIGGLGDVSSEGVRKAGVMGVDLGVLGQEVGADDVLMG